MSIDFATLQGLTIPEGVVTQIADAAGDVLWKQAPKSVTVILRPTADVLLTHSVYPSGSAGYACIDDEVADGDATYIYGTAFGPSIFTLSGTIPNGMKVTSAKLITTAHYYYNIDGYNAAVQVSLNIGGTEYRAAVTIASTDSSSYALRSDDYNEDAVSALNTLGFGNISLPANMYFSVSTENKSNNVYITQFYIELTCEK